METMDALLISAGWVRQKPNGNPILIGEKALARLGSENIIAPPRDKLEGALGLAASGLLSALIAEGIPVKEQAKEKATDSNPDAILVVIGKRP